MKSHLKFFYQKQVIPQLQEKFQYQNIYQIPHLEKIVVNRGIGKTAQNTRIFNSLLFELTNIVTQRGVLTSARKAIAGFKIRENTPIGLMVTLRGERIYAFLDRLINLAFPRIRDFQGVSFRSYDGHGNYSFGCKEQLIFLEVRYDQINQLCGINLSIVTMSNTNKERLGLFKEFGIPFR